MLIYMHRREHTTHHFPVNGLIIKIKIPGILMFDIIRELIRLLREKNMLLGTRSCSTIQHSL
jgi:hypothetical protein